MLLNNYTIRNSNPGREFGGETNPYRQFKGSSFSSFWIIDANPNQEKSNQQQLDKSAFFNGYRPPYSLWLSPKSGGLATQNQILCSAAFSGSIAGGLNAVANLTGSAVLSATMQLIVQAAANITAGAVLSGTIVGVGVMSTAITAGASLTATLQSIGNIVAAITAGATLSATPYAIGNMQVNITSDTELSPASLAAAVWNALAADFNSAGTMGELQNMIDALNKLAGLDLSNPMTVTTTDIDVDTIHIDITGDGTTTSTLTRTT